ncbi:hypothetical protein F383_32845 [Gossypium arboreum]|nr:hypothetical protein F383_32845 [Gossypium arboreum]
MWSYTRTHIENPMS